MTRDLVRYRASGVWRYRIQNDDVTHDVLVLSAHVRFLQTPIYGRWWSDVRTMYRCLVDGEWAEKDVLYETLDDALGAAQERITMMDERDDGERRT